MNSQSSFYEVLNISKNASTDEIRTAYRRLMKTYHPDRYLNEPQKLKVATEVMKKLNTTRDTLMDPVARQRYDATVRTTATKPATPKTSTSAAQKWTPPDFGAKEEAPKASEKASEKAKTSSAEPAAEPAKSSATAQKSATADAAPAAQEKAAAVKSEQPINHRAKQAAKFYEDTARCGDGFLKSFIDVML
ncbi:DnaJ domain-containing protein [Bdellovibrio bacteriovorus]|nr:DnaJ domain-containing protein [Bdellovibrio bacteriovorus]